MSGGAAGSSGSSGAVEHTGAPRGATEHDAVLTLDDIVSLFEDSTEEDAKDIFAAALSLRDANGRARKQVLRNLARTWGGCALTGEEGRRVDGSSIR